MALSLLTHGGHLITHGGRLVTFIPAANPMLHGYGALRATAISLRIPGPTAGHGTLTAATMPRVMATSPPSGVGTLTATAFPQFIVTAAVPGHGVATATAKATMFTVTAAASGHGGLAASVKIASVTVLPGHGALTAARFARFAVAAGLPGHGALAATAKVTKFTLTAALPGHGALTAVAFAKIPSAAASSGHGALTAVGKATKFTLAAAVPGHGALTGKDTPKLAAALPGHGVLTGKDTPKLAAALPGHGVLSATTKKVVAFDTHGGGNVSSATPATLAETHVITAGANCIIAAVGCWAGQTATVKVGTTAMTAIGILVNDNNASADGGVQLYQLLNSGLTGSQTITATWAGTKPTYAQLNSLSFFNVTTVGSVQATSGASSSLTQTVSSATNGMIAQAFTSYALFGSTGITAYSKTQDYNPAGLGSLFCICLGHTAGAASVTFTATMAGTPDYAGIAVSLT